MLYRLSFAAPVLFLLLAADAQSGQIYPPSQSTAAASLAEGGFQRDQLVLHADAAQVSLARWRHDGRAGAFNLRTPFIGNATSAPRGVQKVLALVSKQDRRLLPTLSREAEHPFQYYDLLRLVRQERRLMKGAPDSFTLVELTLPASGWLLGLTILGGLLLDSKRQHLRKKRRQPLRYSAA